MENMHNLYRHHSIKVLSYRLYKELSKMHIKYHAMHYSQDLKTKQTSEYIQNTLYKQFTEFMCTCLCAKWKEKIIIIGLINLTKNVKWIPDYKLGFVLFKHYILVYIPSFLYYLNKHYFNLSVSL